MCKWGIIHWTLASIKQIKLNHLASVTDAILTKAGDVQDPNEVGGSLERKALVDPLDHMIEEAAVHSLGQSVPGVVGLLHL